MLINSDDIIGYVPNANRGAILITDIIEGPITRAILTTYELEISWLIRRVPALLTFPTLLVHGHRDNTGIWEGVEDRGKMKIYKPDVSLNLI